MATARTDPNDFDAVLEDLFLSENTAFQKGYEKGYQIGKTSGNPQGYHLGYHRGAALGREFGFYLSVIDHHIELNDSAEVVLSERTNLFLSRLKKLLEDFPYYNYNDDNINDRVNKVRTRYKKACELLKISSDCPFDGGNTF